MKVKLLRKVRKRFKLLYIEHVGYDDNSILYAIYKDLGFKPFYYAYDGHTEYSCTYHEEKQPCLDWILNKVRNKYTRKVKGDKDKITSVNY